MAMGREEELSRDRATGDGEDASDGRMASRSRLAFSTGEVERYCRQMTLPQFGVEGQRKLKATSVLVVGAGGLGCPAALYLAAAGVGVLGVADCGDTVDRSNLHRQIAHADDNVGVDKTISLAESIRRLNPSITVDRHSCGISPDTAVDLLRPYDVVLDCTDNVLSRYIINDACMILGKPLVSGAAIGFDGQLSVYGYQDGDPCYRCIFPSAPPPQCVGSCDTAGVLGPVPGLIGTLQATEAIKIAAGIKGAQVLSKRLLLYDGLRSDFRVIKLRSKNPACVACGEPTDPSLRIVGPHLYDYQRFVSGHEIGNGKSEDLTRPSRSLRRISVRDLAERMDEDTLFLDVRPKEQFDMCSLDGFRNVPVTELSTRLEEVKDLARGREIILVNDP